MQPPNSYQPPSPPPRGLLCGSGRWQVAGGSGRVRKEKREEKRGKKERNGV